MEERKSHVFQIVFSVVFFLLLTCALIIANDLPGSVSELQEERSNLNGFIEKEHIQSFHSENEQIRKSAKRPLILFPGLASTKLTGSENLYLNSLDSLETRGLSWTTRYRNRRQNLVRFSKEGLMSQVGR